MDQCIVNRNSVKRNPVLKADQKDSKKYYGDSLFEKRGQAPKNRIQKLVKIRKIPFCSLTEEKGKQPVEKKETWTAERLMSACREKKLLGGSGNGYLIADKLEAYEAWRIDSGKNRTESESERKTAVLLINGVECDPGLVHDAWIYRNRLDAVERGVQILKESLALQRVILATREPLRKTDSGIEQIKVQNRFPMGYENYLIKTVLGVELHPEERPTQRGILVMNLQSVMSIGELEASEADGDTKYITVANLKTGDAAAVRVKLGTDVKGIVRKVYPEESFSEEELYTGHGAMGCHRVEEGESVTGMTGFIGIGQMPDYSCAGKCAGCGRCTRNCPAGVDVRKLVTALEKNCPDMIQQCHPERCIFCGSCTYGCMAGKDVRGLVASVRSQS
jgi:Na+-translocating ferredoxin:NAD+ oxidoreductase subunit C